MYSLGPGIYILCLVTRPHSEEGKRVYTPSLGRSTRIGKPRNDFIAFASTAQASPSSVVCLREQPEQSFALRYNNIDGEISCRHFGVPVPFRSTELNELKYSAHSNDKFHNSSFVIKNAARSVYGNYELIAFLHLTF